jgi:hypothetical protein
MRTEDFPKFLTMITASTPTLVILELRLTNFGTYGHGFVLWPEQPSCEFPLGSGIEHLFDGGIWIGGYRTDNVQGGNRVGPFVTTGAIDVSSVTTTRRRF